MESAIELLVGLTVGCLIAGLIHAVILRAAAKWVEKLDLGFGSAYVTALYVLLANAVLAVGLGWALPDSVSEDEIDVLSIPWFR